MTSHLDIGGQLGLTRVFPNEKHFNDLLERESSERGKDEVSYFYVGDVFCMPIFKKKSSGRFLGKVPNFVYYIKNNSATSVI